MTPRLASGWLPEIAPAPPVDAVALGLGSAPKTCYDMIDAASSLATLRQVITPSCVSQAVAAGARLRSAMQGDRSPQLPSRRWLHRHARGRDAGRHFDLPDTGTHFSTVCAVSREIGWPTEEHWPWDDAMAGNEDAFARNAWLNENPPASVRRHAYDQRSAIQEHAIVGEGALEAELTKAAFASHYPIMFGATVTQEFKELEEWEPADFDGTPAGGHGLLAIGHDEQGVIILNWWGEDWGVGGLAILSWRCWLRQCRDKRIIQLVERATT